MTELLRTVHGSRLYGLAHAGSDHDVYVVTNSWHRARKNDVSHTVKDGKDVTVIGLSSWLRLCDEGVPQALEAMFTPWDEVGALEELRAAYRVNRGNVRRTYSRTAKNFVHSDTMKKRRSGLRLLWNMSEALQYGVITPRLPLQDAELLTQWANDPEVSLRKYEELKRLSTAF